MRTFHSWRLAVVLAATSTLALLPARAALAATAPGAVSHPAKLWTRACGKTVKGAEVCFAQQFAVSQSRKAIMLRVQIGYMGGAGDGRLRLVITTPLGVALPAGVSLTLGKDKPLRLPFETCQSDGCVTMAVLQKDVGARFLTGKQLMIGYVDLTGGALTIPVNLMGLDEALTTGNGKKS